MKTAIITGASSGLGAEFALSIDKTRPEIEEIWLIARRKDRLEELARKIGKKTRVLSLDVTEDADLKTYLDLLEKEKPDVKLLINNAGFGRLGEFAELSSEDSRQMLRLNCEAVTVITRETLPFMSEKSEIINTCSIASFAPNARMAVYSSTKAYIMSFSRALRQELKPKKIKRYCRLPRTYGHRVFTRCGNCQGNQFHL